MLLNISVYLYLPLDFVFCSCRSVDQGVGNTQQLPVAALAHRITISNNNIVVITAVAVVVVAKRRGVEATVALTAAIAAVMIVAVTVTQHNSDVTIKRTRLNQEGEPFLSSVYIYIYDIPITRKIICTNAECMNCTFFLMYL